MSTPFYLGQNQPLGNSGGVLSRIGSFFGGSGTPAYAAAGQPAATNKASSDTPSYAPRSPAEAAGPKHVCVCMQAKEPEPTCPIDPEAIAAGQIAIVIPRQGT